MTKSERQEIKDFIYNVLVAFQNQEDIHLGGSYKDNFDNPMFDKAIKYLLGRK